MFDKMCRWSGRGFIKCNDRIRIKKSKICDPCSSNPRTHPNKLQKNPYGGDWYKFSSLFKTGKICESCGEDTQLITHHIIPVDVAPNLIYVCSNLTVLCEKCHGSIHKRESKEE